MDHAVSFAVLFVSLGELKATVQLKQKLWMFVDLNVKF